MTAAINYNKFIGKYWAAVFAVLAVIGGINFVVDPNGRVLWIDAAGFNKNKVVVPKGSRSGTAFMLRNCQFAQIVVGSSRSQVGINPNAPAMAPGPGFNAAQPGSNAYEMRRTVEYVVDWQKPLTVWYGVDFEAFGRKPSGLLVDFWESPLAGRQPLSTWLPYLFSARTLLASFETIVANRGAPPAACDYSGLNDISIAASNAGRAFRRTLQSYVTEDYLYGGFEYSEERLMDFKFALEELAAAEIETALFIPPVHAMQLDLLTEMGLLPQFEQWKRDLVAIVSEVNATLPDERKFLLWDFTGYHKIATEAVPEEDSGQQMLGFFDSSHFRPEIGDKVTARIRDSSKLLGPAVNDFGRLLNSATIETVISDFRVGQERYRREYPEALARLREWRDEVAGSSRDSVSNAQPLIR